MTACLVFSNCKRVKYGVSLIKLGEFRANGKVCAGPNDCMLGDGCSNHLNFEKSPGTGCT